MTTLTTVSRPVGMRPRNLISITVDTPALPTAAVTLVWFIESIIITGGDIRPYTRKPECQETLHHMFKIQIRFTYSIESRRVSRREMIYSMSENITVTSETSLTHIRCVSTSQLLATESPQSNIFFIFLFLSLYNSALEAIEPSLLVALRGETAVKNILLFMSNFPSSHSPAQIKHATSREKETESAAVSRF